MLVHAKMLLKYTYIKKKKKLIP